MVCPTFWPVEALLELSSLVNPLVRTIARAFRQDACVSKIQALFEEQKAATGNADPMLPQFAADHRRVVARFGR